MGTEVGAKNRELGLTIWNGEQHSGNITLGLRGCHLNENSQFTAAWINCLKSSRLRAARRLPGLPLCGHDEA